MMDRHSKVILQLDAATADLEKLSPVGKKKVALKSQLVISVSQGRMKTLGTRSLVHSWQCTGDVQSSEIGFVAQFCSWKC